MSTRPLVPAEQVELGIAMAVVDGWSMTQAVAQVPKRYRKGAFAIGTEVLFSVGMWNPTSRLTYSAIASTSRDLISIRNIPSGETVQWVLELANPDFVGASAISTFLKEVESHGKAVASAQPGTVILPWSKVRKETARTCSFSNYVRISPFTAALNLMGAERCIELGVKLAHVSSEHGGLLVNA